MFRNCLAAAWRSACNDRFYAILNTVGLALGFAIVVLIWLFVRDELSYNLFLDNYQDAYRLQLTIAEAGQKPVTWQGTPDRLAAELKLAFPDIVATARDVPESVGLRHNDVEATENIDWVDADFLKVLGFPLLQGNPATALTEPDSIVLSRTLALKYFGTIFCLGQSLDINRIHPARVTAIAEDPPSNASIRFVALMSGKTRYGRLAILDANPPAPGQLNVTVTTFIQLRAGTSPSRLAEQFPAFVRTHYASTDGSTPLFASLYLNPLAALHLHAFNPDTTESDGRIQTLYAVAVTGALILMLAGVNFVNLLTARATRRALEVGVRKGAGALPRQLMIQFMGESLGYALAGALLGMVMAELFLPTLNAFLDRRIALDPWNHPLLAVAPCVVAVLLGLAAGFYPAFVMSRIPAATVLKARSGALIGGGRMRLSLVVFQFTVTIALVIATIVIYQQNEFAMSRALGSASDLLLTIDLTGLPSQDTPDGQGRRERTHVDALRTQLSAVPGVEAIAASFVVPPLTRQLLQDFGVAGQNGGTPASFSVMPVDFGYFSLYRIPVVAGRDFSRKFADDQAAAEDKTRFTSAIVNAAAVRVLGFADPAAAIGQEVQSTDPDDPARHYRIIGVVSDFSLDSIRNRVLPSIFIIDPDLFNFLSVKLTGDGLAYTLRGIDAAWHGFVPDRPIDRAFLDDRVALLYLDISRSAHLFTAFAGFAVAIGCLGLIGLSAYTAERRTKEIGIRKALGASTLDVSWLLIRQLAWPVLLANALAWPIAWWFMRNWLDGFAYRIELGPLPFLTAGLGAIAIAVATTAFHAVKVASARPVQALRYE